MAEKTVTAIIDRLELSRACGIFAKVVDRRNKIPVLGYLRVDMSAGQVRLYGTDQDISAQIDVDAEVDGVASFTVQASRLAGFARSAAGPVTLSIAGDHITISDGEMTLRLQSHISADDMPSLDNRLTDDWRSEAVHISASQGEVSRALGLGAHCISAEETRYYLNGTHLCRKPGGTTLRAVSTDGHRLACIDTAITLPGGDWKGAILPTKAGHLLSHVAKSSGNEPFDIQVGGSVSLATLGNVRLIFKMIDGTFPDYGKVIPKPSEDYVFHLGQAVIKRMSSVFPRSYSGGTKALRLDASKGVMSISEVGSGEVTSPMSGKAQDGRAVAFNVSYLTAQARVTDTFTVSTEGPNEPARIIGDDPDALWVIMPMMV